MPAGEDPGRSVLPIGKGPFEFMSDLMGSVCLGRIPGAKVLAKLRRDAQSTPEHI